MTTKWGRWENPPDIRRTTDRTGREVALLLQNLVWIRADGTTVVIPAGFVCDGATVPRVVWSLVGGPFDGPYLPGAILHDFLLSVRTPGQPVWGIHKEFYNGMRANNTSWLISNLFYRSVQTYSLVTLR